MDSFILEKQDDLNGLAAGSYEGVAPRVCPDEAQQPANACGGRKHEWLCIDVLLFVLTSAKQASTVTNSTCVCCLRVVQEKPTPAAAACTIDAAD